MLPMLRKKGRRRERDELDSTIRLETSPDLVDLSLIPSKPFMPSGPKQWMAQTVIEVRSYTLFALENVLEAIFHSVHPNMRRLENHKPNSSREMFYPIRRHSVHFKVLLSRRSICSS